jgi:hypothetical protein
MALEYAPDGVAGSIQGNTRESAVLQYDNYGLKLAAIYYNGHDTNPARPPPVRYHSARSVQPSPCPRRRRCVFASQIRLF